MGLYTFTIISTTYLAHDSKIQVHTIQLQATMIYARELKLFFILL